MIKRFLLLFLLSLGCFAACYAQVPRNIQIQILKAQDARRYDTVLEKLLSDPDPAIRMRSALAAGRIGNDAAIGPLADLLQNDRSQEVRTMAAFGLGEIESTKAADIILKTLRDSKTLDSLRARAVEAAGKIAAANPKDEKSKELGEAILNVLTSEGGNQNAHSPEVIRLGLTAALRVRPPGAEEIVRKFLAFSDPKIVADALNTLARLRAKNANRDARDLLATSVHALIRANAVRLLGAAEDKTAIELLLKAAVSDNDSRVRVSAIRSLGSLKESKTADKLLDRGDELLAGYKRSKFSNPIEKNELIEIASVIGRLLPNSDNSRAVTFLAEFDKTSGYSVAEIKVALAQVSAKGFFQSYGAFDRAYKMTKFPMDWHLMSALVQGLGELAKLDEKDNSRERAIAELSILLAAYYRINSLTLADMQKRDIKEFVTSQKGLIFNPDGTRHRDVYMPVPDLLTAYAAFKPEVLDETLRNFLKLDDVQIRTTVAGLIAEQPASNDNISALKKAFDSALLKDKLYNDAQLALMDALYKIDKKEAVGTLLVALSAPDYLVRKKVFELLDDKELQKNFPGIPTSLKNARAKHKDQVLPYSPAFGTKLGQILNTDADYGRALSRKNGTVKAILTTEKGAFTIDLLPEDAPLTVDNFIKLANSRYFNGVEVHRVVPNFVMQDGDPRGDGNGGPGWSIRDEINMVPYERGAVGMALSGKDTGGSQWFVTHSPQPHLDGGYTVFGIVNETDMKIVDNIVRGDKIISVKIVEGNLPPRTQGEQRKQ